MKKEIYNVLLYEGHGSLSFIGDGYETLEEAVKYAQDNSYGSKFYIVKIVEYKSIETVK